MLNNTENNLKISFVNKVTDPSSYVSVRFISKDKILYLAPLVSNDIYDKILNGYLSAEVNYCANWSEVKLVTILENDILHKCLLVGIGSESEVTESKIEHLGGIVHKAASAAKIKSLVVEMPLSINSISQDKISALFASGATLASYRFEKYQTKKTPLEKFVTSELILALQFPENAQKIFAIKAAIASGVFFARDCVSEVPNILFPDSYAQKIVSELDPLGVDIVVLGEREMRELGMGALLGVGQGSINESKVVVMEYNGGTKGQKPICFVGKGVTFDSGGISIKPSAGMGDMKYDMGGSATVVGLMKTLALRGAKVNVVGIVGLVENMPGGNAQRPGDVVRTMSGQTVEILNTDAEGRLVLCDCLSYVQEKFSPEIIIDLATLTGAIVIALGNSYAGCFANDDILAENIVKSGKKTSEKVWLMPMDKEFDDMLKSPVADMANIGGERGVAGSATAAHFLARFIKEGVKWAHLDIAGVAWDKSGKNPLLPAGAVGYGVRLLNQLIYDYYESK